MSSIKAVIEFFRDFVGIIIDSFIDDVDRPLEKNQATEPQVLGWEDRILHGAKQTGGDIATDRLVQSSGEAEDSVERKARLAGTSH